MYRLAPQAFQAGWFVRLCAAGICTEENLLVFRCRRVILQGLLRNFHDDFDYFKHRSSYKSP